MPYKYYMGKTGRVWNVTKRAVGVELLKTVGNRSAQSELWSESNTFENQTARPNS